MLNAAVPPADGTPPVSVTVPLLRTLIAPLAPAWVLVTARPKPFTVMPLLMVAVLNDTAPPAVKLWLRSVDVVRVAFVLVVSVVVVLARQSTVLGAAAIVQAADAGSEPSITDTPTTAAPTSAVVPNR